MDVWFSVDAVNIIDYPHANTLAIYTVACLEKTLETINGDAAIDGDVDGEVQ